MKKTVQTNCYSTSYKKADCNIGVIHLGFGAFHRAHQAVYFDDLMEKSGVLNCGIAAVNLKGGDSKKFARVAEIKNGYLLKTVAPDGRQNYRLVRPHLSYVDWPERPREAENLFSLPEVQAVTITITESGYSLNSDHSLNLDDSAIVHELKGGQCTTIYGFLANALAQRAEKTDGPISILCCDNIRENGTMLARNLNTYLQATKQLALAQWVSDNVAFPNSMVDRITPRANPALEGEIQTLFPGQNLQPIHAEEFCQWVIEDSFNGAMPDLGHVGVEIVPDANPYEEAKIRILNGGHTGLTYLGALAGYKTFDQAMADDMLRNHFDAWENQEVLPGLDISLPFDKSHYLDVITARFKNQAIADQLERICVDGYTKMSIYIRPTLAGCLQHGITPYNGYNCVASWIVFSRRWAEGKISFTYHEPYWGQLQPLLAEGKEEEIAQSPQLWGELPEKYKDFVPDMVTAIKEMEKKWPA